MNFFTTVAFLTTVLTIESIQARTLWSMPLSQGTETHCPRPMQIVDTAAKSTKQIFTNRKCLPLVLILGKKVVHTCLKDHKGFDCLAAILKVSADKEIQAEFHECMATVQPTICSPNTPFVKLANDFEACGDKSALEYLSDDTLCSFFKAKTLKNMCETTRSTAVIICQLTDKCEVPVKIISSAMHDMCTKAIENFNK